MRHSLPSSHPRHKGFVLISSLLLLLVVTILAISMFRSFGMQERIAGNVRDKQRAVQAAASTQQYAEWWLATQSFAPTAVSLGSPGLAATACTGPIDANVQTGAAGGQICLDPLGTAVGVSATAWPTLTGSLNGTGIGVAYSPPCVNVAGGRLTTTAGCPVANDAYFGRPRFYIADVGPIATARGEVYQIDAYSYGLSPSTIAVVESTVSVTCTVCDLAGL